MDIFSHGLYGGVAFGRESKRDYITAFLFGIGPDLVAFAPFFLSVMLGIIQWPEGNFAPPNAKVLPEYVYFIYSISHSLIVYAIFFAVLWLFGKKSFVKSFIFLTLGWPLHVLMDIPTHSNGFFPTPFLWPISDFSVNGMPWAAPQIIIPNILVLILLYLYWYIKRKNNF